MENTTGLLRMESNPVEPVKSIILIPESGETGISWEDYFFLRNGNPFALSETI
jgi:hypothetical protein